MTRDSLANGFRVAHDIGLAAWVGGSMFGKFALNPAVSQVSSRAERGKVVNTAWSGYSPVNTTALGAVTVGWFAARVTEANPWRQTEAERQLSKAKDALVIAALVTGTAHRRPGCTPRQAGARGSGADRARQRARAGDPAARRPESSARSASSAL
ncbi:MAG: hypothetical protein WKF31_01110 [Thermoleophilaceae bacterium]